MKYMYTDFRLFTIDLSRRGFCPGIAMTQNFALPASFSPKQATSGLLCDGYALLKKE